MVLDKRNRVIKFIIKYKNKQIIKYFIYQCDINYIFGYFIRRMVSYWGSSMLIRKLFIFVEVGDGGFRAAKPTLRFVFVSIVISEHLDLTF
jgi:hypothetical protein